MSESTLQTDQLLEDIQIAKYLDILRRRKWWVILTTTVVFVATLVVAMRLPNLYRAETVILVDPQKVPDTYVPSTGNTTIADRLSTVRQEVMSPTRLKELLTRTGLYSDAVAKKNEDAVVRQLQKSIQLEVVDAGSSRLSAFRIAYTGRTAAEAALVPNEMAEMIISKNVQARQEQSSGTAEFLQNELEQTKKQLEQKEAELGRIKSTYIMDLPESKQFHLEALATLRNQLQASQDRVSRAQQEKMYLQSTIGSTNTTVDLDADSQGALSSPEEAQVQRLESRLSELGGRYGPSHPDVRKTRSELEQLKAKIAAEQKAVPAPVEAPRPARQAARNPVVTAQLNKLEQDIQEQTKLQKQLEGQVSFHSSKLEREPVFEQQMAGLMRDYDTLRAHYNHLLDKKLSADMYTSLVSHEEGERFVILDRATVPTKPFAPNRFIYGLVSLLGGFLAGTGLAIIVEMTDPSVRNEQEAASILGKSVFVGIPIIITPLQSRRALIRTMGTMALTIVSAGILGFVASYLMAMLG
jgi:succinoglycan biosynthesis transport protein ExoP